jgi:putative addiction module component (TIGR02574 family)
MSEIEKILEKALRLSQAEKSKIIDQLIKSLDQPDKEIDKLWSQESESRIDAFDWGDIKSLTVEEAFLKYKSKP